MTEVLSMVIANHIDKQSNLSYEAKGYPHSNWRNHHAFKVLRKLPKYSDEAMVHSMEKQVAQENVEGDDTHASENQTPQ